MEGGKDKNKIGIKIGCTIIVAVIIFQVIELLRPYLPADLYHSGEIDIKLPGLLILGVYYLMIVFLVMCFDKWEPKLSDFKIVLMIGACVFITEFIFKFFQLENNIRIGFLKTMEKILLMSAALMALANIRVHKIRKKKTVFPSILAFVIVWVSLFIYKYCI
jgi:hypothetical protein